MARIRALKPDFWSDSKMVKLSAFARLFYMGMWNFSLCEQGHLPDDAEDLKLKILPADPVDGDALLAELIGLGRVTRRMLPDGRTFLLVPTLSVHQKADPRWRPRCAYCAASGTDQPAPEPTSGPDPRPDSPELAECPPDSPELSLVREGKGREGITAPTVLPAAPAGATVTQRSKRITDAYAGVEPMCRWPAVNGIVIKAIKAARYADDEIHAALMRLAADGRSVTVETLRVELAGIPPRASPRDGLVEHNGMHLKPETVTRMNDRRRFEAMDAAGATPLAIEGLRP